MAYPTRRLTLPEQIQALGTEMANMRIQINQYNAELTRYANISLANPGSSNVVTQQYTANIRRERDKLVNSLTHKEQRYRQLINKAQMQVMQQRMTGQLH